MSCQTYRNSANLLSIGLLILSILSAFSSAAAQNTPLPRNLPVTEPSREPEKEIVPPRVATGNDLYCAGFISAEGVNTSRQIIGAEEEDRLAHFAQGNVVYTNFGGSQNVRPGMLFAIVRPQGKYTSHYTGGIGTTLGTFTRELGVLRIIEVQGSTSTARIVVSCDEIQLGDVLLPFEERQSPATTLSPLPRYQPTSGRNPGRILMQRNQKELLSARDVVYIDLGRENGVKAGDTFTIFRKKPDDGNITSFQDDDVTLRRSYGYQSDKFKGGDFSLDHPHISRERVRETRPAVPSKILGELVVISTQAKTATAVVTRTTQEVRTGDRIEQVR